MNPYFYFNQSIYFYSYPYFHVNTEREYFCHFCSFFSLEPVERLFLCDSFPVVRKIQLFLCGCRPEAELQRMNTDKETLHSRCVPTLISFIFGTRPAASLVLFFFFSQLIGRHPLNSYHRHRTLICKERAKLVAANPFRNFRCFLFGFFFYSFFKTNVCIFLWTHSRIPPVFSKTLQQFCWEMSGILETRQRHVSLFWLRASLDPSTSCGSERRRRQHSRQCSVWTIGRARLI